MAKFMVQAVQRQGYDGSWRIGRKWPSGAPVEIDVVDDKEDPPQDPSKGIQIGQQSFNKLKDDRTLRILPAGDPLALARAAQDVPTLRAEVERLSTENERLRKENERLSKGSSRRGGEAA